MAINKKGTDIEQMILDIHNFLKNHETTPEYLFKIYILLYGSFKNTKYQIYLH